MVVMATGWKGHLACKNLLQPSLRCSVGDRVRPGVTSEKSAYLVKLSVFVFIYC